MSSSRDSDHERGDGMPSSLESIHHLDVRGKPVHSPAQKKAFADVQERLQKVKWPEEDTEETLPAFVRFEMPPTEVPVDPMEPAPNQETAETDEGASGDLSEGKSESEDENATSTEEATDKSTDEPTDEERLADQELKDEDEESF